MRARLWKHRALLGYLGLVAVVLLALEIHHRASERTFTEQDRRSCEQRQVLARNQVFVLNMLTDTVRAELHSERDQIPMPIRIRLERQLAEAEQRLSTENPIKPC